MDPSLKDRESQIEDNEPQADDNEPHVNIEQRDGNTIVQPSGMTRREMRQKQWNDRVGGVVEERTRPVLDKISHLERTIEGLTGALQRERSQQAPQPEQQRQSKVDPEFLRIRRRQGEIHQLLGNAKTQQDVDRLEQEYFELDQQALDMRAGALADQRVAQLPRPVDPETQYVRSKWGDVISNQRAGAWASAEFQKALIEAGDGPVDRMALHDRVLQAAAEKFNIRRAPAPAPRAHEQARFGGAPPASGGTQGSRGGFKLSREQQEIAHARFKDLPPAEAERAWSERMLKHDPHFFG